MMTNDKPLKLSNAPLVHVLAQVLFNPVSEMDEFIQQIEVALRDIGFLDREEIKVPSYKIDLKSQNIAFQESQTWIFVHKDQTRSVSIEKESFIYQTSSYDCFKTFSKGLLEGLGKVREIVSAIQQVRRLGLRYVNLIKLDEREEAGEWVRKELLGDMLPNQLGKYNFSKIEKHLRLSNSENLIIRYCDRPKQPPLPPGIVPQGLLVPRRVLERGTRFILLDLDGFRTDRFNFDIETIDSAYCSLNHAAQAAFESCTTENAMKKWECQR